MARDKRFETLRNYVRTHTKAIYQFYDREERRFVKAVYVTDYENSDAKDVKDGYNEHPCILFQKKTDGSLFEIDEKGIPARIICDGRMFYM